MPEIQGEHVRAEKWRLAKAVTGLDIDPSLVLDFIDGTTLGEEGLHFMQLGSDMYGIVVVDRTVQQVQKGRGFETFEVNPIPRPYQSVDDAGSCVMTEWHGMTLPVIDHIVYH